MRRIFSNGTIFAIVGNGTGKCDAGFYRFFNMIPTFRTPTHHPAASNSPDGLPGTLTCISTPSGVAADPNNAGSFLFTDTGNFLLRYYNATSQTVSTLAGTRMVSGVTSSNAALPATSAVFSVARTVRPFGAGWLIADYNAHVVRMYWPNGTIQTGCWISARGIW